MCKSFHNSHPFSSTTLIDLLIAAAFTKSLRDIVPNSGPSEDERIKVPGKMNSAGYGMKMLCQHMPLQTALTALKRLPLPKGNVSRSIQRRGVLRTFAIKWGHRSGDVKEQQQVCVGTLQLRLPVGYFKLALLLALCCDLCETTKMI